MNRNLTIDLLKIILSFFVVGLHGSFFQDIDPVVGYMLKQGLFRCAVPVFLIISGYYFYRMNSFEKELKFIGRLFLLYTIWFLIYIPIFHKKIYPGHIIHEYLNGISHLWYMIHAVYAFFLLSLLKRLRLKWQMIVVGCLALCGLFLQYNNGYDIMYLKDVKDLSLFRNALFFCLPFIYIGFLVRRFKFPRVSIGWVIAGAVVVLVESYLNHFSSRGSFDILLGLYFFCPALFIWAIRSTRATSVKYLSQISTGVYLVHPYFLKNMPIESIAGNDYTMLTLSAFGLSVLVTLVLILINKKIKCLL
jgi:surface polysaccharide O-acyltransferase-like enzyme